MLNRRSFIKNGQMDRRNFLKFCGLAASSLTFSAGTIGCSSTPKSPNAKDSPEGKFSLEKFDEWFKENKMYNGINPNSSDRTGVGPTFKISINMLVTPGIGYYSKYMYAAAPGTVFNYGSIDAGAGRMGGNFISIDHPGGEPHTLAFKTFYSHLGKIMVKKGQPVIRGEKLAEVESYTHAKIHVRKKASYKGVKNGNFIDPDNYGLNHSYMNYADKTHVSDDYDMVDRIFKQRELVKNICDYIEPSLKINQSSLEGRQHRATMEGQECYWDDIEIFRYLDELYKVKPNFFPGLTPDRFSEKKNEFYANQPIVFSLPIDPT